MTFGKIGARNMLLRPRSYWGLCLTAEEPGVVVNMAKTGSPPAVTLETSRDGVTWETFDADGGTTPVTLAKPGDHVYFRAGPAGNARMSSSGSAYRKFTLSARCAASGNVMSLISATDPGIGFASGSGYALARLFYGCTSLTAAPTLPATTLAGNCYFTMFLNCTSLTAAPALPAKTLADFCYQGMFYGCTSLTAAPALPATTLANYCYSIMFRGCTSLAAAPELPAKTLAFHCYSSMFEGCTSLREVEVAFSAWASDAYATEDWLVGVSSTGTFRCPAALGTPPDGDNPIARGESYCPVGWTVVNTD